MTPRAWAARLAPAQRALVPIGGTLPMAVLGAALLARFLPVPRELAFAIGFSLALPVWVAAMCVAFLATRPWRAAIACVLSMLLLVLLARVTTV